MIVFLIPYIFFALFLLIFFYKQHRDKREILRVIEQIKEGNISAKVDTANLLFDNRAMAEAVNCIGRIIEEEVEKNIKYEKFKASLITNVSHDIKTPLTSIINYVGLIKREQVDNPKIRGYLDILEAKSYKLKDLTEDLVEASKISSGNIRADLKKIDLVEMINQSIGENYDRFEDKNLSPVFRHDNKKVMILADPGLLSRVIENLFGNIYKYALKGTVVHMEVKEKDNKALLIIKNVSAAGINIDAEDLSERFVRGDESRSSEGYGLGLSIAKSLTKVQGGSFKVRLDGDLFKTCIEFEV
ncbi:MAG: HAMP domain-containing histidine kinase [Butyrivibrio sp.]|nr:HAMP domain-containing histidine kinase [Butyrivibrio sp.]